MTALNVFFKNYQISLGDTFLALPIHEVVPQSVVMLFKWRGRGWSCQACSVGFL